MQKQMTIRDNIYGKTYEVFLLDEMEYKKDHPVWGDWSEEKCLRLLDRPKLFEGKRFCFQGFNRLHSIPPSQIEFYTVL